MLQFTDEQIRDLIKVEQMMDEGKIPYVILEGHRCAIPKEAMEYFDMKQEQTITWEIFAKIQEYNIGGLQKEIIDK